ncbi:hypothetical protein [Acinetobacter sp.]|uniref:hypothetical protein n=1 Tax=Acinetobacter sp. TaxID=472 RepID=UPI00388E1BDA
MKTFKEHLLEESTGDLSDFRKNAETMLSKGIFLYRGTRTARQNLQIGDFTGSIQTARTIQRKAKGSRAMTRVSSKWEIPDRSLSYFATRDASHASTFGNIMLVIPGDDVSFYAWTATDFNQSTGDDYKRFFSIVEIDVSVILSGTSRLHVDDEVGKFTDLQTKMLKALKAAGIEKGEAASLPPEDPRAGKFIDSVLAMKDDFEKSKDDFGPNRAISKNVLVSLAWIEKALRKLKKNSVVEIFADASPKAFKIKTFTDLADIPKKLKSADELWFNGKYLAINLDSRHTAETNAKKVLELIIKGNADG